MSTTVRRAGIYKLQLSHRSGNGLVFDFYRILAKMWPSYANTFPMKRKLWLCAFSNAKKQNHGLNSLTNVHIYYEDCQKL